MLVVSLQNREFGKEEWGKQMLKGKKQKSSLAGGLCRWGRPCCSGDHILCLWELKSPWLARTAKSCSDGGTCWFRFIGMLQNHHGVRFHARAHKMPDSKNNNCHSVAIIIARALLLPALRNNRYDYWCQKSVQAASSALVYLLQILKPHRNCMTIDSPRGCQSMHAER